MQPIPCPKTPVKNQSMLNNHKGIHQQGTGTNTTETSIYLCYNKCRLWQVKAMPDSRYTIQNRPKCKNTSTSEKAQDMCFATCQKKLCFLVSITKLNYWRNLSISFGNILYLENAVIFTYNRGSKNQTNPQHAVPYFPGHWILPSFEVSRSHAFTLLHMGTSTIQYFHDSIAAESIDRKSFPSPVRTGPNKTPFSLV